VNQSQPICDYEGTSYRANFWEGKGRDYENLAERIALKRLLPPEGQRLVEIGAGFGRLADLYSGYHQVVLLDYAKSGLLEAQQRLGSGGRFLYVAANLYHLPLAAGSIDTALTIRVLHHVADVPAALAQIAAVLRPGGAYVLEFANKRNLKAIARYLARRQSWSPFDAGPYEFTELNFDFHPDWMVGALSAAGFAVDAELAVSHFRHPLFKRTVPPAALANLDGLLQRPGAAWKLTPSVFVRTHRQGEPAPVGEPLLCCPACGSNHLSSAPEAMTCSGCGQQWPSADGIYDFRWPRPDEPDG
jgi:SAM-dependent methyltransferase